MREGSHLLEMKRLIFILLLWPVLAWGAWKPHGLQTVRDDVDTTLHRTSIGGQIWNYPNGGTWQPISNVWVQSGSGANRKWTCNTDVLKVEQNRAGRTLFTVTWDDTTYTMIYQLNGIVLEDTLTGAVVEGFNVPATFGTPVIVGDTLRWTIYSGVIFEVIKQNGNVIHRFTMEPAFSLWAIEQAKLHPEWAGCAVATDVDVTLTNIANPTGTKHGTTLKQWQTYALEMGGQWLEYTDKPDTLDFPVMQGWAAGQFRERVNVNRMDAIMTGNAAAKIKHNDQVTILAAGIEDAQIAAQAANVDKNYGGGTDMYVSKKTSNIYNGLVRVTGVAAALGAGATISAAACSLKAEYACAATTNISAYRGLKPWVEGDETGTDNDDGDVTWNDWASDASEWGTAGCENASDAGADNSSDGSGYDRWATAESTVGPSFAAATF